MATIGSWSSRRRGYAAVALVAVVGVTAGLIAGSGGGADASGPGPTAEVVRRTLRVTDTESGTLGRADTTTVLYDGTGGRVGGGPAGSDRVSAQSAGIPTPASFAADPCPGSSPSTSSSTSTPTSTSMSSTTTSTTAPCPTTTTTPPTTSSTVPVTTTTVPGPPPTTWQPDPDADPDPGPDPVAPTGRDPRATGADTEPTTRDGTDQTSGSPTATLTELLAVGQVADRGSVLYRADDEPIVVLLADDPLFRDLAQGVADGPDVTALEANLEALGFGSGVNVDRHFDAATAAAVSKWEQSLGRAAPDGTVTVGEVVFLAEPTQVLEHSGVIGDLLEPGDAVLVLGAQSRVIDADVAAEDAAQWSAGTLVSVDWGDGTLTAGSVISVGRAVVGGEISLVVGLADGAGTDRPVGSRVDVVRTVAERPSVTSVPVAAVIAGRDGPAVRVVERGEDRLVPVELGVVDAGWVEVTVGVEPGTRVRLPG